MCSNDADSVCEIWSSWKLVECIHFAPLRTKCLDIAVIFQPLKDQHVDSLPHYHINKKKDLYLFFVWTSKQLKNLKSSKKERATKICTEVLKFKI